MAHYFFSGRAYCTREAGLHLYKDHRVEAHGNLDLDLDRYVANHPFTGIGATVGGVHFAGTIGSWLLLEPI